MESASNLDTQLTDLVPTTVVRIKRRLGSETPDSIFVSSKKRCLGESTSTNTQESSTTLLQKLTTVSEDDHLELHLQEALKLAETKLSTKLRNSYKLGYQQKSKEDIKKEVKLQKEASKFKFICSKRKINLSNIEGNLDIHFFDAITENETPLQMNLTKEDVITCNGEPMKTSKNEYVYDLYYTSNPVEHSSWIENICEVQTYNSEDMLVFDNEDQNEKSDSDDENDEDNWRNDYPDEDEDDLLYEHDEDYLCEHLGKAKIDSDESYDEDDYDETGDFDEDGNLVLFGLQSPFSTLKKVVRYHDQPKAGDEASDDEEYN